MTDLDQKAREITAEIQNHYVDKGEDGTLFVYHLDVMDIIAAALHSVRTETLEEAARLSDQLVLTDPKTDLGIGTSTAAKNIATAIRSLKQKDAP